MSVQLWLGDVAALVAGLRLDDARALLHAEADDHDAAEYCALDEGLVLLRRPAPWIRDPDDGPRVDRALAWLRWRYVGSHVSVPLPAAADEYVARRDAAAAWAQLAARGDCPRTQALVGVVLSGRPVGRPGGYPELVAPGDPVWGHLTAAEVGAVAREMAATRARYRSTAVGLDGGDHALRVLHGAVRRAADDGVGLSTRCG